MTETAVLPLPERFNFARHLFDLNGGRADRCAFIDDDGSLTYGDLERRSRQFAAGLRAAGLRREDRVLLLMHDCNDWPVAFLGALHAGVVPVAVNTMLTAADYAYMLAHCRAQAAVVSSALLPCLQDALRVEGHEIATLIVSRAAAASMPDGAIAFDAFVTRTRPSPGRRTPRPTTWPSGCIRRVRPDGRRAPCTRRAACGGPRSSMASRSSA